MKQISSFYHLQSFPLPRHGILLALALETPSKKPLNKHLLKKKKYHHINGEMFLINGNLETSSSNEGQNCG